MLKVLSSLFPRLAPFLVFPFPFPSLACFLLCLGFGLGFGLGCMVTVRMWGLRGRWCSSICPPTGSAALLSREEVKMSLVVRKNLKMGPGKIAAQCAHAAVGVVEEVFCVKAAYLQPTIGLTQPDANYQHPWIRWHDRWRVTGSTKVVLQCADEASLRQLAALAKEKSLPHFLVRDAGRTQIPAGSRTVLAIGPGPKNLVDQVTGPLKLL